jgi:CO/xanthine dehydrogenase FAD-binding subunit
MKLDVLTPQRVLDINALPLHGIDASDGLRIGALERIPGHLAGVAAQCVPAAAEHGQYRREPAAALLEGSRG